MFRGPTAGRSQAICFPALPAAVVKARGKWENELKCHINDGILRFFLIIFTIRGIRPVVFVAFQLYQVAL